MGPPGRRSSLLGATAGMAVGTALSRVTGVIKLIVLVYAVGNRGSPTATTWPTTPPT